MSAPNDDPTTATDAELEHWIALLCVNCHTAHDVLGRAVAALDELKQRRERRELDRGHLRRLAMRRERALVRAVLLTDEQAPPTEELEAFIDRMISRIDGELAAE